MKIRINNFFKNLNPDQILEHPTLLPLITSEVLVCNGFFLSLFVSDTNKAVDLFLLIFYYLNFELVLLVIIFAVLLNKVFFRIHGLYELITFLQGVLLIHIVWLIIVSFDPALLFKLTSYFPWQAFFLNQYFYFFSTTALQLRLLIIFYIFLYFVLTLWSFYYLDRSNLATLSFETFALFLGNIIFCSVLLKVNNLFAAWCLVECISILAYILTAANSKASMVYSFAYFVFNSIAGALILWGVSLLSLVVDTDFFLTPLFTTTIVDVNPDLVQFSFCLLFVGFFIKLGLIPFHLWAVQVYKNISTELLFFFLIINKTALIFTIYRISLVLEGEFKKRFWFLCFNITSCYFNNYNFWFYFCLLWN